MTHPRAMALLVLAALAHALILWRASAHLVDLDHDSTIAHLAATGHQQRYADVLADSRTSAGEVRTLLQVDERWPLRRIADDLARTDIHPPLYFWLLHAQLLAAGSSPRAFVLLNGLIGLATLLAVFAIGRRLWDPSAGASAALVWAVADGVLQSALHARPYALLALVSLLFVRLALATRERGGRPGPAVSAALVLVMTLGLLTQFHFSVTIAAVLIALALQGPPGRRSAWSVTLAGVAALAAMALLHPGFVASIARQVTQAEPFAWGAVPARLAHYLRGLQGLAHMGGAPLPILVLAAVPASIAGWRAVRAGAAGRGGRIGAMVRGTSPAVRVVAVTALVLVLAGAALYVGHRTPFHATGGRYHASLWPLLALLAAGGARALLRDRAVLPLVALAAGIVSFHAALRFDREQRDTAASPAWRALSRALVVVTDHDRRGVLPRALAPVPAPTPVFVARGAETAGLLAGLRAAGAPVVFLLHPGGDPALRAALAADATGGPPGHAGLAPGGAEVLVGDAGR